MAPIDEVYCQKSIEGHRIERVAGHVPVDIEQGDPQLVQLPVEAGQLVGVLAVDIKLVQIPR